MSGWFNDRAKKLAYPKNEANPNPFLTRIHRSEYYLRDLLDRFGDAELAWMIAPRPLMIEAGAKGISVNIGFAREEFKRVQEVYGASATAPSSRPSKDRTRSMASVPFRFSTGG